MAVLGVFVGAAEQSVCVAQDGRILAAECVGFGAAGAGDASTLETVGRCLAQAATAESSVEHLVFAGEAGPPGEADPLGEWFPGATKRHVTLEEAHLALLRASAPADGASFAFAAQPGRNATAARVVDGFIAQTRPIRGGESVPWVVGSVAAALGLRRGDPVAFLEDIAGDVDEHTARPRVLSYNEAAGVAAERDVLARRIAADRSALAQQSPHLAVQHARQGFAADILIEVADVLSAAGSDWLNETGGGGLTLAGGLFSAPAFVARIARRLGDVTTAPAADDSAVALGAALSMFERPAPLTTLALGPSFEEQDIKRVLENCRLDYVYEPQWGRLLALVSRLLSGGSLVAWFQGRSDFGRISFGSRSILADPSAQFVRENVNSFLLRRPASTALSVVMASSLLPARNDQAATEQLLRAPAGWRSHLGQAIDRRGNVRVSVGRLDPALMNLLECHRERTGIGALVNVPLAGFASPLAHTPREAIRSVFGSAADLLVIGRFVVAKDFRLLRHAAV